MAHPHWPLFDLAVRTPRIEVRYPDDELLFELAALPADGVHEAAAMPFLHPWTRAPSPELERSALRHWWGHGPRGRPSSGCSLAPSSWRAGPPVSRPSRASTSP